MIKVEIYNHKTGEVIETKEFPSERALERFEFYFASQASPEYGYREVSQIK